MEKSNLYTNEATKWCVRFFQTEKLTFRYIYINYIKNASIFHLTNFYEFVMYAAEMISWQMTNYTAQQNNGSNKWSENERMNERTLSSVCLHAPLLNLETNVHSARVSETKIKHFFTFFALPLNNVLCTTLTLQPTSMSHMFIDRLISVI